VTTKEKAAGLSHGLCDRCRDYEDGGGEVLAIDDTEGTVPKAIKSKQEVSMDSVTVGSLNFKEAEAALKAASDVSSRFAKTALFRFARRVAKRTKTDYLSGRPGIKGGLWKRIKDNNVSGFTAGKDISDLRAVNKVSRVLRTHVEGATITPKQAGFLFLSRKSGKAAGKVFARVKSVTIPARVHFETAWRNELPRGIKEVNDALYRAANLTLDQRMKVISQYINKVASHS